MICILRLNWIQLIYTIQLLFAWSQSGIKKYNAVFCGLAMPPGFIAMILKLFFNTPYIIFAHGAEFLRWQKSKKLTLLMKKVLCHANLIIARKHLPEEYFELEKKKTPKTGRIYGKYNSDKRRVK